MLPRRRFWHGHLGESGDHCCAYQAMFRSVGGFAGSLHVRMWHVMFGGRIELGGFKVLWLRSLEHVITLR